MSKESKVNNEEVIVNKKDYQNLIHDLKSIITNGQYQFYKTIDNVKVKIYWQIGERIVREEMKNKERAEYEKYLINCLTSDLNLGKRVLYKIIKFYRIYPIVPTVSAQLSWSHYVELIELEDQKERTFYEQKILIFSWSIRILRYNIDNHLYQKTDNKDIEEVFKTKLPAIVNIKNIFKPNYDFNFLEMPPLIPEKELENKIINNIAHFLKELGEDFSFLGRQVPILIDNEKHYIDLVLYHRGIPCIVLVDLKTNKLNSRDIGQMNKYIGYYRNNRQYNFEKDAIGLIICREAGREEVIYALNGLEEKIFVSVYKTKLPSEDSVRRAIMGL